MSPCCSSVTLPHAGVPQDKQLEDTGPAPISPVFRTGSEPLLSPRPRHTRPSLPGNMHTHFNTFIYGQRKISVDEASQLSRSW